MMHFQRWLNEGIRRRISSCPDGLRRFKRAANAPSWITGLAESSAGSNIRTAEALSVLDNTLNVVASPTVIKSATYYVPTFFNRAVKTQNFITNPIFAVLSGLIHITQSLIVSEIINFSLFLYYFNKVTS